MKTIYLITESQRDADLLSKVVSADFTKNVKFVAGQGIYSAQSLARSFLAVKDSPVALVVGTYTVNDLAIQEQKDFLQEALHQATTNPQIFRVFLAVPEVESLLFCDPYIIENLFGKKYSFAELEQGQMQPRVFINELIKKYASTQDWSTILEKLDTHSLALLRKYPFIREITEFLSSMNVSQKQLVLS